MIKEAILWKGIGNGRVECRACARLCKIPQGSHGFCYVRQNHGGKLVLANYGIVEAMQLDPIEKKPFNHFMPGSYVFGIGTSSCNWGCQFCQNHNISKEREIKGVELGPEEAVRIAAQNGASGIAFTYNEPTIFIEYALDVARAAHGRGMSTMFVTNGYMTADTVHAMRGLIDAVVVNFKGSGDTKFSNKFEMVQSNDPIKESLAEMKRMGMHVEMTDLVIPRVGDSLEACDGLTRWIHDELGAQVPIHFTRFHPDYKMLDYPSTGYAMLKKHYDIARGNGLDYVYIGNMPGNRYESTYCPRCGSVVVGREGYLISKWNLDSDSRCMKCGEAVPMVGGRPERLEYREIRPLY